MKRLRDPRWFLILMFLAIIGGVPLVQMLLEIRQEEGIRAFEVFSQPPTAASLRAYQHSLESANWASRLSRPWFQRAQFKWLRDGGSKAVVGRDGWYFYKPGLNYMLTRPDPSKAASAANDPLPAILDFRDRLAARGVKLMILPVPNKESVYPDRLTPRAAPGRGALAPGTRDLLERLCSANIEVIDLFQTFAQARERSSAESQPALYLAQDTHWSPAGVKIAARTVSNRLQELGWARPGGVEYVERAAPVKRLGDILRMMQMPSIERLIQPETVPCAQVIRADSGEPYKESADADVLVLGDSFMRVYQQDEPGAAGFVAHLARELKQPVMSLVNDGGGATLVRQELQGRPAFLHRRKVVVWEFVERDIGLALKGWPFVPLPQMVSTNSVKAAEGARKP